MIKGALNFLSRLILSLSRRRSTAFCTAVIPPTAPADSAFRYRLAVQRGHLRLQPAAGASYCRHGEDRNLCPSVQAATAHSGSSMRRWQRPSTGYAVVLPSCWSCRRSAEADLPALIAWGRGDVPPVPQAARMTQRALSAFAISLACRVAVYTSWVVPCRVEQPGTIGGEAGPCGTAALLTWISFRHESNARLNTREPARHGSDPTWPFAPVEVVRQTLNGEGRFCISPRDTPSRRSRDTRPFHQPRHRRCTA
jgi:hypothetical protein